VPVTIPGDRLAVGRKMPNEHEPVSGLPERLLQLAQGLPGIVTGTQEGEGVSRSQGDEVGD